MAMRDPARLELAGQAPPIFWRRLPGIRTPEEVYANIYARASGKPYRKIYGKPLKKLKGELYEKWKEQHVQRQRLDQFAQRSFQMFLNGWRPGMTRNHLARHKYDRDVMLEQMEAGEGMHYHHNYGYDQFYMDPRNREIADQWLDDEMEEEEKEREERKTWKKLKAKYGHKHRGRNEDHYGEVDVYFDRKRHHEGEVCYGSCCTKDGRGVKHVTLKLDKREKRKLERKLRRPGITREEAMRTLRPALKKLSAKEDCGKRRVVADQVHLRRV